MLKKRILASSMASVMALSSISVVAFAEDLDMEDTVKKYNEAVTKDELQQYYDSLKDFAEDELDKYGTVQGEYFSATYSHVEQVLENDNSTDKDYTAAYQMLKAVKDKLVIKKASDLKSLMKDYEKLYEKNNILNPDDGFNDLIYTAESFADFSNAYEDAEFYVDSDDSRNITDAWMTLKNTKEALSKKDDVTKTEFKKAMQDYQDIKLEMSNYESWRKGTWDDDGKGSFSDLIDAVYGANNAKYNEIAGEYDRLTQAKNVSRTTDEKITKAYNNAQKYVKLFNSWKPDEKKSGSKSKAATLLKEYHNRLVEMFNTGAIFELIGYPDGEKFTTANYDDLMKPAAYAEKEAQVTISDGTTTINVTWNREKHTLIADKEFFFVIDNATDFAVGTDTADIENFMFVNSTASQAYIADHGGSSKYTEQRVAAKTDMLQYFGYNRERKAKMTGEEYASAQTASKKSAVTTALAGKNEDGEKVLLEKAEIEAASDVEINTTKDPVVVSAAVYNLMGTDVNKRAADDAPSTEEHVYYYIQKVGGLATDADAAAKTKADAHNTAVEAIDKAAKAYVQSLSGYEYDEKDLTLAKNTFAALYNKYKDSLKVAEITSAEATDYDTITAGANTNAKDTTKYRKKTTGTTAEKEVDVSADLVKIMTSGSKNAAVKLYYIEDVPPAGQTTVAESAEVKAHNDAVTAIANAISTYNTNVGTALSALQTAYTNATTPDDADATVKDGNLLAEADGWKHDFSSSKFTASSDSKYSATGSSDSGHKEVTIPGGIKLSTTVGADDESKDHVFTTIKDGTSPEAGVSDAHNKAVETLDTAYKAYKKLVVDGDTSVSPNVPSYQATLKKAYDDNKAALLKVAADTAANFDAIADTVGENNTYKKDTPTFKVVDEVVKVADSAKSGDKTFYKAKFNGGVTNPTSMQNATLAKINEAYYSLKAASDVCDKLITNKKNVVANKGTQDTSATTTDRSVRATPTKPATGTLEYALYCDEKYRSIEASEDQFDNGTNQSDALDILAVLTDGGKTIPTAKGSTQEWTLIWRYLAYELEEAFPETKSDTHSLNDLKKKIDDAQDYLDKTADASLFSEQHNKTLKQRAAALDWYQNAKATTGWKSNTTVEGDTYYPNGAKIAEVYNDLNTEVENLKKWFEGFKYSYDDIRDIINEVAQAIEKGEVKGDELKKELYNCANLLATHEASDVTAAGTAEDNSVFDDEGVFQPNNRLKTAEGKSVAKPNEKEQALQKSYEALKDLFDKAKNPTSDVPGDVDGSGTVDVFDLAAVISASRETNADLKYDLNSDGVVNAVDVAKAVDLYYAALAAQQA